VTRRLGGVVAMQARLDAVDGHSYAVGVGHEERPAIGLVDDVRFREAGRPQPVPDRFEWLLGLERERGLARSASGLAASCSATIPGPCPVKSIEPPPSEAMRARRPRVSRKCRIPATS